METIKYFVTEHQKSVVSMFFHAVNLSLEMYAKERVE